MVKFQAPNKYIQGKDLLDQLGTFAKPFASNYLILSGKTAMRVKKEKIEASFASEGIKCTFVPFNGECTYAEIDRIAGLIKEGGYDGVIGLGGGKVLDTAKAAAYKYGYMPLIIAPTIASSDAPCSSSAVIYTEEGTVSGAENFNTNPLLVIMDSQMIVEAPVHTLVAGMGDALATYFEARVCYDNGFPNTLGTDISLSAMAMARLCYDTLIKDGPKAKEDAEKKTVTPEVEHIIEANTLLSGLGFESGGLSCAHSVQDALTTIPECHKFLHGYRVAFGTLCLMNLVGYPEEEIEKVMDFCTKVGLPITFAQLDLVDDVENKIRSIIPYAYVPDIENQPYRMPPGSSAEKMYEAIMKTDEKGRKFLQSKK